VNFKVLYIGRENGVFVMFCFCVCQLCSIESGMGRYELIQMVVSSGTCFSEPRASDLFMAKVQTHYCGLARGLHVENYQVVCVIG
jgi:hypothetical protein